MQTLKQMTTNKIIYMYSEKKGGNLNLWHVHLSTIQNALNVCNSVISIHLYVMLLSSVQFFSLCAFVSILYCIVAVMDHVFTAGILTLVFICPICIYNCVHGLCCYCLTMSQCDGKHPLRYALTLNTLDQSVESMCLINKL